METTNTTLSKCCCCSVSPGRVNRQLSADLFKMPHQLYKMITAFSFYAPWAWNTLQNTISLDILHSLNTLKGLGSVRPVCLSSFNVFLVLLKCVVCVLTCENYFCETSYAAALTAARLKKRSCIIGPSWLTK